MIDAFKVGVNLSLTDNVSAASAVIQRNMLGLNQSVVAAQNGLNRATVAAAGFASALAGGALLAATAALARHGHELLNEQVLLRATGATASEVAQSTARSWEVAGRLIGTSVADNLRQITNLRNIFGDLRTSEALLPEFQRAGLVLQATTGKDASGEIEHLARFIELRGKAGDPAAFQAEMDAMTAMFVSNRGAVAPREMVNFMQRAGLAGRALDTDVVATLVPSLIQATGSGHTAGTMFAALTRQVIGGIMTAQQAETMSQFGLLERSGPARRLTPAHYRELRRQGLIDRDDSFSSLRNHVVVNPRAVPDRDLARRNPFEWIQKHLVGNARFAALNTNGQLDVLVRMFGTETGRRMAGLLSQNGENIRKDRENYERTRRAAGERGERVGDDLLRDSPTLALDRVGKAFGNLFTALGTPAAQLSVPLLNRFAEGVQGLAATLQANPEVAKTLLGVALGLGAVLLVAGTIAVLGAGLAFIGAPLIVTVAAVGAAIVGLGYLIMNVDWNTAWEGIKWFFAAVGRVAATWGNTLYQTFVAAPLDYMRTKIGEAASALGEVLGKAWTAFADWQPRIASAIAGFAVSAGEAIQAIVDWIVGIPGRVARAMEGEGTGSDPAAQAERRRRLNGRGSIYGPAPSDEELERMSPEERESLGRARRVSYAPAGRGQGPERIEVPVTLDGREITRVVADRMGREASGPQRGTSRFDGRMTPMHPGAVFST